MKSTSSYVHPRALQSGQGMSEYIIMTALIAVASIAVFGFFGNAIAAQVGVMAGKITGQDPSGSRTAATNAGTAGVTEGAETYDLSNFEEGEIAGGGGGGGGGGT